MHLSPRLPMATCAERASKHSVVALRLARVLSFAVSHPVSHTQLAQKTRLRSFVCVLAEHRSRGQFLSPSTHGQTCPYTCRELVYLSFGCRVRGTAMG